MPAWLGGEVVRERAKLGGWLSVGLVWGATLALCAHVYVDLNRSYQDSIDRGARLATSYVRLVAEHAVGTFDRADLVLEQAVKLVTPVDLAGARSLSATRRHEIQAPLIAMQARAPAIVSMTVTDREGFVFANTVGTPPGGSLGDRRYFLALKDMSADGPVVSEVVKGRVSNKWGIQIARRILDGDGRFGGMVVANVGMTGYMDGFYGSLALGEGSVISLRDGKHRMLVRHPVNEELLGKPIPSDEVAKILGAGDEGWMIRPSPVDGVRRIVAVKKLPSYDIYALVGIPVADVLGAWVVSRTQAILVLGLAILAAGVATLSAYRRSQSDKALREHLSFQDTLLQTLPIPIFARDRSGHFVACNRAYEEFMGLCRGKVIGRTVHDVFPPDQAKGYSESDGEILAGGPGKHYQNVVVAAGGQRRQVVIDKAGYVDDSGRPAGVVGVVVDITEREALERELRRLATTDPLTGVGNRRHFLALAENEMSRVHRHERNVSVITFDIDHFKQVNDGFGHAAGDKVIKAVAESCELSLRDIDVIGRIGGEEFAILLPETDLDRAADVAGRLLQRIRTLQIDAEGQEISVTASFGVSQVQEDDADIDPVLRRADAAMYRAKEGGRNQVVLG